MNEINAEFWDRLDRLVQESQLVIDRPRGTSHPRYPQTLYPLDYGYLAGTTAMDGGGIDVWRGTGDAGSPDAILCTLDLLKKDAEIKILLGCTAHEKEIIRCFYNESDTMQCILISRD